MDDAVAVGEARRLQNLQGDVDGPDRVDRRLLPDDLLERAPGEVLHRDVVDAVVVAAVIDADHVGMLEPRCRLRLTPEALNEPRVLREAPVQQLESDAATELL